MACGPSRPISGGQTRQHLKLPAHCGCHVVAVESFSRFHRDWQVAMPVSRRRLLKAPGHGGGLGDCTVPFGNSSDFRDASQPQAASEIGQCSSTFRDSERDHWHASDSGAAMPSLTQCQCSVNVELVKGSDRLVLCTTSTVVLLVPAENQRHWHCRGLDRSV